MVSLGQHANRARVFRYTRKDAQPAKKTVADILAAADHFLERAEDGARLQVDWLQPTSEDQNSFFRAQVHNHCKALVPPVTTVTEGRVRDPGVRGEATGGYVTVINTVRTYQRVIQFNQHCATTARWNVTACTRGELGGHLVASKRP